uniref:Uncharacterized protein n=1 Tax=Triticum urartu TaxID=4572 RepID=A0A8R7U703_TRIUA
MVAPAPPPLNVKSGRGTGRRRRGNRTPLLFPAPSSNPVAEVTETVLKLDMLARTPRLLPPPDLVNITAAAMSLSTLSRARPSSRLLYLSDPTACSSPLIWFVNRCITSLRAMFGSLGLSARGPWRVPRGAAFAAAAARR